MQSRDKKEAVNGILFNDQKTEVLLIKRRDIPVWVLPGGGIEPNESPEKALLREFLEETGYLVKIKRKVATYLPVNRMTQKTHFFECEVIEGSAITGNETKEIQCFSLKKLPKELAPPYKGWILDAMLTTPSRSIKKSKGSLIGCLYTY